MTEGVHETARERGVQLTLPHLGQSPLMTNSASSLASSPAARSPFRRLDARVGCRGSLGLRFSLFFAGGLCEEVPASGCVEEPKARVGILPLWKVEHELARLAANHSSPGAC